MQERYSSSIDGIRHTRPAMPAPTAPARAPIEPTKNDHNASSTEVKGARAIFGYAFLLRKTDSRAKFLLLLRVLLDWKLYIVVFAPIAIVILRTTPDHLMSSFSARFSHLTATQLQMAALGVAFVILASTIAKRMIDQLCYGIKLKTIDHRVVNLNSLFVHWLDTSPANLVVSGLCIITLAKISSLAGLSFWQILHTTNPNIVAAQSLLIYVLIVVFATLFYFVVMVRVWTRISFSVADHGIWRSLKLNTILFFKNFFVTLGYGAFCLVLSILALGLIGSVVWAQAVYLQSGLSQLAGVILVSVGMMLVVLTAWYYQIWSKNYWATIYYQLVHAKLKARASEYLTVTSQPSRLILKFFGLSVLFLLLLGGLSWAVIAHHTAFASWAEQIRHYASTHN